MTPIQPMPKMPACEAIMPRTEGAYAAVARSCSDPGVGGDDAGEAKLPWAPSTSLRAGMERTYRWIYDQAKAREEGAPLYRCGGVMKFCRSTTARGLAP